VTVQHRLQLGRGDLKTVHLDHLLRTISEVNPPFRFEPSDVPRPIPALRERVRCGLFRQVAHHDGWTENLHLPDLSMGEDLP